MAWKILFTPEAKKSLKALKSKDVQREVVERLKELSKDPEIQKRRKMLRGELSGLYSIRVGGRRYRIVYKLDGEKLVIIVIHVGKRESGAKKEIYQLTKKLVKLKLID